MTQPSPQALHTSALTSLPLLARGKVRDNYAVGDDRILMVASDRLSAFDVIMGEPIPGKGELLTQMALFWFDKLGHICPNHLTGEAPESVVSAAEVPQVRGRSMLVQRLQPIPVEAVVRGYLPDVAANAWDAGVDRSLIPICQDGDDYYCVEEDGTVVLWSAEEELVTEETWESVWHWARDVWLES